MNGAKYNKDIDKNINKDADKDSKLDLEKDLESTIPKFIFEKMILPGCAKIRKEGGFKLKIRNAISPLKIIRSKNPSY
ncbi:MAG: hypothetical protein ACTSRZ_14285 [Promethearchaeota archaeon]